MMRALREYRMWEVLRTRNIHSHEILDRLVEVVICCLQEMCVLSWV